MRTTLAIFKRELHAYFATPVAYVFIVIFLLLTGVFTFYLGGFYESNQADLDAFFQFHPWLYLFLIPAISMRLWAEERKAGTVELLMTLPVSLTQAVLGKYLAAWCFTTLALALTFPIWITVNYLGDPDNGVILAGYLGSLIMAGGFLAIGALLGTDEESGRCLRAQHGRLLLLRAQRFPHRARFVPGLDAASAGRCHRFLQLPHAFFRDSQGCHRYAESGLFS